MRFLSWMISLQGFHYRSGRDYQHLTQIKIRLGGELERYHIAFHVPSLLKPAYKTRRYRFSHLNTMLSRILIRIIIRL